MTATRIGSVIRACIRLCEVEQLWEGQLWALQVDLKDKWRNLERQGVVGPADAGPAAMPGGAQQLQHPDGSVMAQDGQQGLDVQVGCPAYKDHSRNTSPQYPCEFPDTLPCVHRAASCGSAPSASAQHCHSRCSTCSAKHSSPDSRWSQFLYGWCSSWSTSSWSMCSSTRT